jgi:hypothetical protein
MNGWDEDFINFMGIILVIVILNSWWNSLQGNINAGNNSGQTNTASVVETIPENQPVYQETVSMPVTNSGTPTLSGQYIPGN